MHGAQGRLELVAQVLVLGRQAQRLADVLRILVDGEAGRERRDLEQDAARDAEVDRLEVVAVADVGDVATGAADALLPGEVVLVARGPGDVVDAARALVVVPRRRGVVGEAELAVGAFEQVLALALVREAEEVR